MATLQNETDSMESRLALVELLQPERVGREENLSLTHAQLQNLVESDFRLKDLQAQVRLHSAHVYVQIHFTSI